VLLVITTFTAVTDVHGVLTTQRTPVKRPTLDGMAYLQQHSPHELAAFEWLNRNVGGIPVLVEAQGPSYQDFSRVTMNTGLPTVLGWDYHVTQRAQSDRDIRRRKADITTIYTSKNEQESPRLCSATTRRWCSSAPGAPHLQGCEHGAVPAVELTAHPVYQNPGVTIFAVNGQFAGAVPQTTIEEVAGAEPGEETHDQDALGRLNQPRGLAIDAAGNSYVADFVNNRIQKFDANLKAVTAWASAASCRASSRIVRRRGRAGSTHLHRRHVERQGAGLQSRGRLSPRVGLGVLRTARHRGGIGRHGLRRRYRQPPHRALLLRRHEAGAVGSKGDAPAQYFEPTGIAVDDKGLVYVADNGNGRLQITDRNGAPVREFAVPGWRSQVFSEPYVTLAKDGTIWVTVPVEKEVRAYSPEGKLLRTMKGGPDQPSTVRWASASTRSTAIW